MIEILENEYNYYLINQGKKYVFSGIVEKKKKTNKPKIL